MIALEAWQWCTGIYGVIIFASVVMRVQELSFIMSRLSLMALSNLEKRGVKYLLFGVVQLLGIPVSLGLWMWAWAYMSMAMTFARGFGSEIGGIIGITVMGLLIRREVHWQKQREVDYAEKA